MNPRRRSRRKLPVGCGSYREIQYAQEQGGRCGHREKEFICGLRFVLGLSIHVGEYLEWSLTRKRTTEAENRHGSDDNKGVYDEKNAHGYSLGVYLLDVCAPDFLEETACGLRVVLRVAGLDGDNQPITGHF